MIELTFSEYFEILHLSLPDPEKGNDRKVFLRGEEQISWYGLSKRFDVERQKFNKYYISPIKKTIDLGHGIVYLTHEAGFGGTTIARRIAWEIHEDNPTLIMTKFHERKTREILIQLHEKTRKTILIIMEAPQVIALDDVNNLYASISQSRPVVFLVVRRGRPSKTDLAVPDWGNNVTDLIEAYKPFIQERYGEYLQSSKNKELNNIIHSTESYKKTPFYVGLVALESDFVAIHSYIAKFLYEVNENIEQKRTLVYLTLCMDYLGTGLPSTFFRNLFKASTNTNFNLEDYFPSDSSLINALLNVKKEGKIKYWSIRHPFFAKELKRQLLGGVGTKNPEIWKETLSDWCVHFIEDSLADVALSEYMATIFQKLFIGNRIDRSGDKFTQIINDVDTDSAREKLFQTLKNSYPENPHFCSHLARFYAYRIKNNELALKYADQAIRLSQQIAQPDSLLYHIKGMCIRTKIYELIDNLISQKQRGIKISETEFNHIIDNLVPEAAQQFATSRQLNKKDEYGYIAHIQMLVRVLDFAIKVSNKTKSEFISSCKTPYTEWLDLAESLIEEVKLLNWDTTSSYITDCENGLSELYDDYSTILQNLRNYLPKSSDPSRIRRLIVRTYFRKSGNRLTNAPDLLKLMEQNIENEPENTYNYLLWFKVIRFTNSKINDVVDKVSRWNANSRGAIETIYYFYVLKTFQALEGYSEAELEAARLIRECRTKNRQGTISIFDWYGKGMGIHKLISNKLVTDNNKNELLDYVEGYFTEFLHEGHGKIRIANQLDVFFSPTQAKLTSSDLHKKVQFYLGFSYDGLRADSYSIKIIE